MVNLLENLLVMVLSVVVVVAGFYVLLLLIDWWLKFKSGSREQEGLTNLWLAAKQVQQTGSPPQHPQKDQHTSGNGFPDAPD